MRMLLKIRSLFYKVKRRNCNSMRRKMLKKKKQQVQVAKALGAGLRDA